MLNPPKIHFIGDAKACAKWLPFAQKKMQYLMTAFQGAYFHKKFKVPGATIWIDNDGYIRRIYIKAGVTGYEFLTSFRVVVVPDPDIGILNPLIRSFQEIRHTLATKRTKSLTVNGKSFTESNDAISNFNDKLHDAWYSSDGEKMTICNTNSPRYRDDFYRASRPLFSNDEDFIYPYIIKRGGSAEKKLAGGKRRPISAEITMGDSVDVAPGNKGSTACLSGSFEILASAVGYDHVFAVHHPETNQTIQVTPDGGVPSWIAGRVRACWQFAPDGKRAVSLQYWSDIEDKLDVIEKNLEEAPFWKTGVSEVLFNPYLDGSGVLKCDCTLGLQIEGKADVFLLAVDYDLKDPEIMRILRARVYLDTPDLNYSAAVCLLIIGEWSLVDTEEHAILSPYRSAMLYHSPVLQDFPADYFDPDFPPEPTPGFDRRFYLIREPQLYEERTNQVEDSDFFGQTINPLFDRHGYGVIETQLDIDLRRDAWCFHQHISVPASQAYSEGIANGQDYPRGAYRYEWGIDGKLRETYWEREFVSQGGKVATEKDWSTIYPGYVELTPANQYWGEGVLYRNFRRHLVSINPDVYTWVVDGYFSLLTIILRLKPGSVEMENGGYKGYTHMDAAFRLHPKGSFSLFSASIPYISDELLLFFVGSQFTPVPRYAVRGDMTAMDWIFAAPPEMIIDHIEFGYGEIGEDGIPAPSEKQTTHLARFNEDRIPPGQFVLEDKEVVALAPYGVWLI